MSQNHPFIPSTAFFVCLKFLPSSPLAKVHGGRVDAPGAFPSRSSLAREQQYGGPKT